MNGFAALQAAVPFAADPMPVTGRALVVAVVVVGLIAALAWALRRGLPAARGRLGLTVETAVSLGERRSLVIVSVENRRLLLGMTQHQIALITELRAVDKGHFQQTLQASVESGQRS